VLRPGEERVALLAESSGGSRADLFLAVFVLQELAEVARVVDRGSGRDPLA